MDSAGGNYRLQSGSPCVGAGDVTVVSTAWTDADGNPRTNDGTVDIGAYESGWAGVPVIVSPVGTTNQIAPVITWTVYGSVPYDRYELRVTDVTNSSSPSLVWDSGQVIGGSSPAQVGQLLNSGSTYSAIVTVGNASTWSAWSAPAQFTVSVTQPPMPVGTLVLHTVIRSDC